MRMNDTRRLFVGLMADEGMQSAVEAMRSTWRWPSGARMVPRHNLHLTLNFLGEVEMVDEASLIEALTDVHVPELQLTFHTSAVWNGGVVALLAEGNAALDALWRDTTSAVTAAGLESDLQWTPHVTLARHAAAVETPTDIAPIDWAPQALSLVWSRGDGSGYEVLQSWPAIKGPKALPDARGGS
jgi:2'-5' RNA ligase